jgi:hypothetical protein
MEIPFFFYCVGSDETDSAWYADHRWIQMIDEYRAAGGMKIVKGNTSSTQRKSASMPLCPSQIPHDLIWDQAQATAVGSL